MRHLFFFPRCPIIPRSFIRGGAGFTLVEVLVALVISLLGALAIMQIYVGSEGSKRATGSLAEAQSGGVIAAYSIEREVQKAGMGFSNTAALGCRLRSNLASGFDDLFFQPVTIIPSGASQSHASNLWRIPPGDAGSDMIAIASGNGAVMTEGGYLQPRTADGDEVPLGATSFPVAVRAKFGSDIAEAPGIVVGDYLLVAEVDKPCTLGRVQALAAESVTLNFPAADSYKFYGDPGSKDPMAFVFNLGQRPDITVYAVRNGVLTRCDYFVNDCSDSSKTEDTTVWVPMANDAVALIAQYGFDTNLPPNGIDLFCKSRVATGGNCPGTDSGLTAPGAHSTDHKERRCDWVRVPVIQMAVVTRSGQYEKDEISPATIKLWPDSAIAPTTTGPVWTVPDRHYRYRVTLTTSVLRNVVWQGVWGAPC